MNTSTLIDKQIMDLSRTKINDPTTTTNTSTKFNNLFDHHQSDDEINICSSPPLDLDNNNKDDFLHSYDFQPISRTIDSIISNSAPRVSDFKPVLAPLKSYGSVDSAKPSEILLEKAHKVNDSALMSEIDQALKKHTDSIFHVIDSLSARLSKLEKTTRDLEYSVDDLKVSVGNSNGISDGKMRQLENMLLEVQTGVRYIKDKQDVVEGYVQLAKLQNSKVEKSSEVPNTMHVGEPTQPSAVSTPQQQSNIPQFTNPVSQPAPSLPPTPVPQQNIHPPPSTTAQFPPVQIPTGFPPPGQTPQVPNQHYQPVPSQHQPYPQPPQPPQQQLPQFVPPPSGHHLEETPFMPPHPYSQNVRPPMPQPSGGPPQTHQYYNSPPPPMRDSPPSGRSSSGFSAYGSPSGLSDPYPYGGPVSHYGGGSTPNPRPKSPRGGGSNNYPQLPTARIVPQAIPTATPLGSESSTGSGGGTRVPTDDLVDKVANMGFPRDHVRATVRRLTEDGQSVDLNIVLDKLMNDGDVPPPKGWFGR